MKEKPCHTWYWVLYFCVKNSTPINCLIFAFTSNIYIFFSLDPKISKNRYFYTIQQSAYPTNSQIIIIIIFISKVLQSIFFLSRKTYLFEEFILHAFSSQKYHTLLLTQEVDKQTFAPMSATFIFFCPNFFQSFFLLNSFSEDYTTVAFKNLCNYRFPTLHFYRMLYRVNVIEIDINCLYRPQDSPLLPYFETTNVAVFDFSAFARPRNFDLEFLDKSDW